jgi:predicted DNA-binding transcriptional regulator AlpA
MSSDNGNDLAAYGPLLTPEQVAEILQMNPQHLTKLMREGKFPGFKVLGSWRVKRSTMQSVIDGTWEFEQPTEEPND